MSVVEAASDVLKTLLSTKTGYTFATHYRDKMGDKEFLFQYLHPFRPRKKVRHVTEFFFIYTVLIIFITGRMYIDTLRRISLF